MTNTLADSITTAVNDVAAIEDPVERYQEARRVRVQLSSGDKEMRRIQQQVAESLKPGRTWAEVGAMLGVTGSRAEQIAKGR